MFEILKLQGPIRKSITLETRLGNKIENEIAPKPCKMSIQKDRILYQKNILKWKQRVKSVGRYNCLGHVWANRRTAIYSETSRKLIISDDGYKTLLLTDAPFPDDLIVYEDAETGNFLHIGKVLSVSKVEIKILSKWDDSSGEYEHCPEDAPFLNQIPQTRINYITERN